MDKKTFQRPSATKCSIRNILEGVLVEEKEGPTFLKVINKKIYQLNLMAVIVKKEIRGSITNFYVDDGSGEIVVRFFEENKVADSTAVGNALNIIGKIRSYQNEKYISPQIIKSMNPLWLKVRSLELNKLMEKEKLEVQEEDIQVNEKEIKEEKIDQSEDNILPFEKVSKLIKEMDLGSGVLIEEIIEKSSIQEIEQILEKMLENGDIFQNQPGKVKVL